MTMQNISLTFSTDNVGVIQSGANKSTGEKGGFESIIGNKNSGVKNDKNVKYNTVTKSTGKVNVINNGSSSIKQDDISAEGIEKKDIELIDAYMENGELKVQLAGDAADMNTLVVDIDSVLDELKSLIADILDVSEDEIEEVLEQNGMTMLDMFSQNNLQELFVEVEGMEEFSDILTDNNANELWVRLSGEVADFGIQLQQDVSITPEQFVTIVEAVVKEEQVVTEDETDMLVSTDEGDLEYGYSGRVSTEHNAENHEEPTVVVDNGTSVVSNDLAANGKMSYSNQDSDSNSNSSSVIAGEEIESDSVKEVSDNKMGESLFSQFMDKVEAAVNTDAPQAVENIRQMREIAVQVIEGVRINVRPDTTGFEIQLNPEHLGKVNVAIQMKAGVAVANFTVKDEMARVALENQMQSLKETFENQGLKVESIEVTVSDFSFRQNDNSWTNENQGREGNRRRFKNDEELENNDGFAYGVEGTSLDAVEEGSINIRA